jgi:hypothetical protein
MKKGIFYMFTNLFHIWINRKHLGSHLCLHSIWYLVLIEFHEKIELNTGKESWKREGTPRGFWTTL